MNKIGIVLAAFGLMGSTLACCCMAPNINIGSELDVGPLQEKEETVPLGEAESVDVEILFGAGELDLAAGDSDDLFHGQFLYNVEELEPMVSYSGNTLQIQQGDSETSWGWADDGEKYRNEWELAFSRDVPLDMDIKAGAGEGMLDLGGLQLERMDMDMGAGEFTLSFDEPNSAEMDRLTVDAGAGKLTLNDVGNASPERLTVQGGAGDITIDLTGDWSRSAEIRVTAGVGEVTLRLPADVGVRVDVEGGLSSVTTSNLQKSNGDYVNDAYGDSAIELEIQITTGIGQVNLEVAK